MNREKNELFTKILIIGTIAVVAIALIYAGIKINKESNIVMQEEIQEYLNESFKNENVASKSPLYGLLNYNFDEINSLSTDMLIYTNIMSSSEMNNIGIDNIYKSEYGLTKNMYIQSNKYLSNPYTNCYYYQNVLKQSGFNCDSVCSKNDATIRQSIMNKLQWPNVLPEDIDNYCVKNALFPIESEGYFVNVADMKELFKSLTNKELTLDSKITSNKYYKYGAYLETESLRLSDNIKNISKVTSVKKKGDKYIAEYEALTDQKNTLSGKVTLLKENEKYYIISNEINTSNYIN